MTLRPRLPPTSTVPRLLAALLTLLVVADPVSAAVAVGTGATGAPTAVDGPADEDANVAGPPVPARSRTASPLGPLAPGTDAALTADDDRRAGGGIDGSRILGRVPLVTGGTVTVIGTGEGRRYRVEDVDGPVRRVTLDGDTYVFPASVDFDRFDRALFNVDRLLAERVTVAERDTLPLMIEFDDERVAVDRGAGLGEARSLGVSPIRRIETGNTVAGEARFDRLAAVGDRLARSAAVERVHYDPLVSVTLNRTNEFTGADVARDRFGVDGENVTIAILDTGVNETHPDLDEGKEVLERNFVASEDTTRDIDGHGTHVAGIAAGTGDASNGTFVGVAPGASIIDVRVLGAEGFGRLSGIIAGVEFAAARDADVISMSLGGPQGAPRYQDPFAAAVDAARERGSTVVVAAGNGGPGLNTVGSPGVARDALTVAASNENGTGVAAFSSRGPTNAFFLKPDITAPGTGITSADGDGTGYRELSGTSMATPAVSGAAALLLDAEGDLPPRVVEARLVGTADPLPNASVFAQGGGALDVTDALGANVTMSPGTVDFGLFTAGTTASRVVTLTNTGESPARVELTAAATDRLSGRTGRVSLNRTNVTVPPGERVAVRLTVDTSDRAGLFGGRVVASGPGIPGNLTTNFGYARGVVLDVQKDTLGGLGQTAEGDTVVVDPVRSRGALGASRLLAYSGGTVPVVTLGGPVRIASVGTDEATGQSVVTARTVRIGSDRVVRLDESGTVPLRVRTDGLAADAGGTVASLRFETSVTVGETDPTGVGALAEGVTAARVPRGNADATVELIGAPADALGAADGPLDVDRAYAVEFAAENVSRPRAFEPRPRTLSTVNVTYYRTYPNQTYAAVPTTTTPAEEPDLAVPLPVGDRVRGQFRVNGRDRIGFALGVAGRNPLTAVEWALVGRDPTVLAPGETATRSVNEHPLFGTRVSEPIEWSVDAEEETLSGTASVSSDRDGNLYRSFAGTTRVRYAVDNETLLDARLPGSFNPIPLSGAPVENGAPAELATDARDPAQPLSTQVRTVHRVSVAAGTDNTPPAIAGARVRNLTTNNSVAAGPVTLVVEVADGSDVSLSAAVAEDLSGNRSLNATVRQVESGGSGAVSTFRVTVDAARASDPLDVRLTAVDAAGNSVRTTSIDAVGVYGGPSGPPPVAPGLEPPTDPDDDGIYEDVDGSGAVDVFDVQVLLDNLDAPAVRENAAAFDVDGSGSVDVFDVQALLGEV